MFEKFTEKAINVVAEAQKIAEEMQSEYILSEHLLLALVREAKGVSLKIFKMYNITFENLYDEFEGVTFYLQKVMNILYMQTKPGAKCKLRQLKPAIDYIVDFTSGTYEDLLYQLPDKQKRVLLAISKAGKAINVTSGSFAKKYGLISPSSVNSAIKGLLEKDLLTQNKGVYQVYDKFFERWLIKKF